MVKIKISTKNKIIPYHDDFNEDTFLENRIAIIGHIISLSSDYELFKTDISKELWDELISYVHKPKVYTIKKYYYNNLLMVIQSDGSQSYFACQTNTPPQYILKDDYAYKIIQEPQPINPLDFPSVSSYTYECTDQITEYNDIKFIIRNNKYHMIETKHIL